jgi:hypothetical protein
MAGFPGSFAKVLEILINCQTNLLKLKVSTVLFANNILLINRALPITVKAVME